MKNLVLAIILVTSFAAQAQGFFKKPAAPAESPAPAASKPQPVQAPAPAPVQQPAKPKAQPAATPAEKPKAQPRPAAKPRPAPAAEAPPQPAPVRQAQPAPAPQQAAPQTANSAAGLVDPVQECAGGWGIAQAFCRSVQCQKAESFHHPVCVTLRAEQAAGHRRYEGDGQ